MSARPRERRYVRCLLCDRPVTINNLTTHVKSRHPASAGVPRVELYDELEEQPTTVPRARRRGKAELEVAPRARAEEVPESRRAASAPELPPLELDEIVLAVVETLAEPAGLLPVAHLPALFAWREATATFLRDVRPGSTERPLGAP